MRGGVSLNGLTTHVNVGLRPAQVSRAEMGGDRWRSRICVEARRNKVNFFYHEISVLIHMA